STLSTTTWTELTLTRLGARDGRKATASRTANTRQLTTLATSSKTEREQTMTSLPKPETPSGALALEHRLAPSGLLEEIQAIARFWRRRAFFCFVPRECPLGEQDYTIDFEHLEIRHYQQLLDKER